MNSDNIHKAKVPHCSVPQQQNLGATKNIRYFCRQNIFGGRGGGVLFKASNVFVCAMTIKPSQQFNCVQSLRDVF